MKNLLISAAMTLVSFSSVNAFDRDPLSEDIDGLDRLTETVEQLPSVSGLSTEIHYGPKFASVQPTVWLNFKYSSCRTQKFHSRQQASGDIIFVAIERVENLGDCRGPRISRDYNVQLASDFTTERFVVLNPISNDNDRPVLQPRPRICTAIAGMLFNPRTGRCQGFSNGCQRSDLIAVGFTSPKDGQCQR